MLLTDLDKKIETKSFLGNRGKVERLVKDFIDKEKKAGKLWLVFATQDFPDGTTQINLSHKK